MIKQTKIERMWRHCEGFVTLETTIKDSDGINSCKKEIIPDTLAKEIRKNHKWELVNDVIDNKKIKVLRKETYLEYEPFPGYILGGAIKKRRKGGSNIPWALRMGLVSEDDLE